MNDTTVKILAAPRSTGAARLGRPVLAIAAALVAALLLMPEGRAEAHGLDRPYTVSYGHGHRRIVLPYWLRHDAGFHRWYALNHHRFAYRTSWRGLHRHYLRDHRYHRALRRGPGHAHRDRRHGYRGHHPRHRRHGR